MSRLDLLALGLAAWGALHAWAEWRWSLADLHRRILGGPRRSDAGALAVGALHVGCAGLAIAGWPGALAWSVAVIVPDFLQHMVIAWRLPRGKEAWTHLATSLGQFYYAVRLIRSDTWEASIPWWFGVALIGGNLALVWWRGRRAR